MLVELKFNKAYQINVTNCQWLKERMIRNVWQMNWGRSRIKSIKETVRTVKDKCHTESMALYCRCNKDEVAVICMKRIKGLQSIWAMSQRSGSPLSQ